MNNESNRLMNAATRALAIIGFIAVILVGLWGSVSIAKMVPGAFSGLAAALVSLTSVFVPASGGAITLSAPASVASGETIVLSWEHTGRGNTAGTYAFRYSCADGVSFTSPTQSGANTKVFCDTPFNFLNANNSIILTAFSEKNRLIQVPVVVEFTPENASAPTVSGTAILTIENATLSESPTGGTGTTYIPRTPGKETTTIDVIPGSGPAASDPNGQADLAVRLLEIGLVDKASGEFTASSTPNKNTIGKRVAARFAVENLGTKTSDQWTFNAVLPTFPSHIYSSPTQVALAPGDRIEFTLGFDSFEEDNEGILIINVDPTNRINERNKNNNLGRFTITVVQ